MPSASRRILHAAATPSWSGATAREVAMNGRLVKELLIILLIKLALLMAIKSLWFSAPTVPSDATQAVSAHLLD
ncbi:hypothetical protein HWE02_12410 [Pseudomonas oryzihabitans]|uniref:cytochrome oxidase putative small subunit CydP n=1 Tax=Pseudomonas oryzihabitans TaxID=47885 RepID=UPI001F51E190|nr:cytochrome oxidase putative small subunit CydP [Pseudomonas oryzihabitans]MCI1010065.1 hypothetical protein [Pseudomonas oryzihabitans]